MDCATCTRDLSPLCLVPNPDNTGVQLMCRTCAIEHGVYCTVHELAHSYFFELGTAYISCVNETIKKMAPAADSVYRRIIAGLPDQEVERVREWIDDMDMLDDGVGLVFYSIVALAEIKKCSIDEVIQEVLRSQSANRVVPAAY